MCKNVTTNVLVVDLFKKEFCSILVQEMGILLSRNGHNYKLVFTVLFTGGLAEGQMRCGEHTDWTSLTLLIQDKTGGLEVNPLYTSFVLSQSTTLYNLH